MQEHFPQPEPRSHEEEVISEIETLVTKIHELLKTVRAKKERYKDVLPSLPRNQYEFIRSVESRLERVNKNLDTVKYDTRNCKARMKKGYDVTDTLQRTLRLAENALSTLTTTVNEFDAVFPHGE